MSVITMLQQLSSSSPDVVDRLLFLNRDPKMQRSISYQDVGKIAFLLQGACAILLFFFANPLVLRPRFWNLSVVANLWLMDAILLVGGFGLIYRRKWAALLSSAVAVYVAFSGIRNVTHIDTADTTLLLIFLLPVLLVVAFWRTLAWGNRRHDPLFVLAGVVASGLLVCLAFVIQRPR